MSSTPQLPPVAEFEQRSIIDLIAKGRRIDERELTAYRSIKIETGLIQKANGSALVHLGKTKVMTGIKVQLGEPFPDTPNQGVLTVNAELVPMASPSFEPGPPSEAAIELARVVDRGLRESKAIPLEKLCVEPGRKVIIAFVDVYVLDHDGNLIDASAISALAALLTSKVKPFELKDGEVQMKDDFVPLEIENEPVAVTTAKIGEKMILDPCLDEEMVMTSRLTVTTGRDSNLCAMQKGGLGSFSDQEIRQAVKTAIEKGREIRELIRGATSGR